MLKWYPPIQSRSRYTSRHFFFFDRFLIATESHRRDFLHFQRAVSALYNSHLAWNNVLMRNGHDPFSFLQWSTLLANINSQHQKSTTSLNMVVVLSFWWISEALHILLETALCIFTDDILEATLFWEIPAFSKTKLLILFPWNVIDSRGSEGSLRPEPEI